eukprot:5461996-Prymnesium_polylepis.1
MLVKRTRASHVMRTKRGSGRSVGATAAVVGDTARGRTAGALTALGALLLEPSRLGLAPS